MTMPVWDYKTPVEVFKKQAWISDKKVKVPPDREPSGAQSLVYVIQKLLSEPAGDRERRSPLGVAGTVFIGSAD